MKVKFAVEKSAYSHLLNNLLSGKLSSDAVYETLVKMKTIEELIRAQGDEIITIVSTKNTFEGKNVPPMTEEKIKENNPDIVEYPKIDNTEQLQRLQVKVPVISPPCEECPHKRISHNYKGCRFCDCNITRKRGET